MDEALMKAKHWRIFLAFMLLNIICAILGGLGGMYNIIANIGYFTIYFGWFLVLENTLKQFVPKKITFSSTLFTVNVLLFICLFGFAAITLPPGKTYHVEGLPALLAIVPFVAFFQIFYHLSKLLVSIEQNKRVKFSRHIGEFQLFLFYPLNVWFLQPRINQIYLRKTLEEPTI